jgi:hypothetical protein
MPLPFDATLKDLVQAYLPDFERQLDLTDLGPLRPLNVDLSTISAATDIALARGDPPTRIVDLNFQASRDDNLTPRILLHNSLLHYPPSRQETLRQTKRHFAGGTGTDQQRRAPGAHLGTDARCFELGGVAGERELSDVHRRGRRVMECVP